MPKEKRQLSKMVNVRFTPEEHQLLHRIAPAGGIQEMLRSLIDPAIQLARRAYLREREEG